MKIYANWGHGKQAMLYWKLSQLHSELIFLSHPHIILSCQGSANYGLQAKSRVQSSFVKKVLLEQSHTHSFTMYCSMAAS